MLPNTKIQPGQLITDPERPDEPLGERPYPFTKLEKVDEIFDPGQNFIITSVSEGWGGLSIGILEMLKTAWSARKKTYNRHIFEVELLETRFFEPSEHYVHMSMKQPHVLKHLQKNDSVFMVVDVRIAHGAKILNEEFIGKGADATINVPLATLTLGPDVGGDVGKAKVKYTVVKSHVSHSFVFAYRLRECRYDKIENIVVSVPYVRKADIQGLESDSDEDLEDEDDGEQGRESMIKQTQVKDPTPSDFEIQGLAEEYAVLEGKNSKYKDGCILLDSSSG